MTSVSSAAELIHLGMDTSVKEIVVAVLRPGEEVPVVALALAGVRHPGAGRRRACRVVPAPGYGRPLLPHTARWTRLGSGQPG